MRDADETVVAAPAHADARSSRSPFSVAILAAVACMPIVVAAGFLTDRPTGPTVPADISVLALRGVLDGGPDKRPEDPARAGY